MALPADADIPLCLEELGLSGEDWGPTTDSYANLAANWRGSVDCPSEAEMEAAWVTVQANLAQADAIAAVSATDAGYVRVLEDLVDTLVDKGVIALADLPQSAQDKHSNRKALRDAIP